MTALQLVTNTVILLFVTGFAIGQVSPDSVQSLKQQKRFLELSKKVNDNKMKLADMENTVALKTTEMDQALASAQHSADDNSTAANKLSSDPQDKKLARQAESAADDAKKNAKRARIATDHLADLKKDIGSLKEKIARDEAAVAAIAPVIPAL